MKDKEFLAWVIKADVMSVQELARLNDLAGFDWTADAWRKIAEKDPGRKVPVTLKQNASTIQEAISRLKGTDQCKKRPYIRRPPLAINPNKKLRGHFDRA